MGVAGSGNNSSSVLVGSLQVGLVAEGLLGPEEVKVVFRSQV